MAIFDCAIWKPVQNHGGILPNNNGLILHHAVANGSLRDWFDNPSSGVSAHFWVSLSGVIEQYVNTETVAWHAMQMNQRYCGVETEGCVAPPHDQPMSEAMINALSRLYEEGHRRHGWPNQLAEADGEHGFGYHSMGVATACPCGVRRNLRGEILRRAFQVSSPPSSTTLEDNNMILTDPTSGGVWVALPDGAVFTYDKAPYLGGTNNQKMNAGGYPCVGISSYHDAKGNGYLLVLDWGDRGDGRSKDGGDRFRRYRFPRDGSGKV